MERKLFWHSRLTSNGKSFTEVKVKNKQYMFASADNKLLLLFIFYLLYYTFYYFSSIKNITIELYKLLCIIYL